MANPLSSVASVSSVDLSRVAADSSLLRKGAIAIVATAFIALCAHLTVPLPFTPIPIVAQDFAVLLTGLVLGPQLGLATLLLYLAEGAAGLPVFNPHGVGGLAQLFGPTGGFLMAYPLVAVVAGVLSNRSDRFARNFMATAAATVLLFLCGASWFAVLLHTPASVTLGSAVMPFLPGAVVKCALAAGLATTYTKWRVRTREK